MKKNNKLPGAKDKISEKIGLTGDIILGATIITIEADHQMYIENYKGIINYTDTSILIEGKKNKILVEGQDLQIEYYTNMDMKLKGKIQLIKYC